MKKIRAVLLILLLVPFMRFGSADVQAVSLPPLAMDRQAERASLPVLAAAPAMTIVQFGGLLGFVYSPSVLLISFGDTVRWEGDFVMHPLVSDDALWTTVNSGAQFEFTFNTPGVYHFHCFFHGASFGMAGTIAVGLRDYIPGVQK